MAFEQLMAEAAAKKDHKAEKKGKKEKHGEKEKHGAAGASKEKA